MAANRKSCSNADDDVEVQWYSETYSSVCISCTKDGEEWMEIIKIDDILFVYLMPACILPTNIIVKFKEAMIDFVM